MIQLTTVIRCHKSSMRCLFPLNVFFFFHPKAKILFSRNKYAILSPFIFFQVLEINYQGHPQQDLVKLHAEIHFPNIDFSSTTVDFGCVLNYTETRKEICITNCSPMSVSYRWTFLVDEELKYVCTDEKCVFLGAV